MASSLPQPEHRRATNNRTPGEDSWVDVVADGVGDLLREEGLDCELIVFYDPLTETLHAVGYDGAPARYFRGLEADGGPSVPRARRGKPMVETTAHPAPPAPNMSAKEGA